MSRVLWVASLLMWGAAAGWGLWVGLKYESTSAEVTTPLDQWPAETGLARDHRRATLIVFVHPKCPCTRATIRELDRLLARHRENMLVYVIILKPSGVSPGWEQTGLLAQVNALPDVHVVMDHDGIYRQQFRASTSGECLLYDVEGQMAFHGGITPLRGHEGPSVGQAAIAALLLKTPTTVHSAPVFGCALETSAESQEVSP